MKVTNIFNYFIKIVSLVLFGVILFCNCFVAQIETSITNIIIVIVLLLGLLIYRILNNRFIKEDKDINKKKYLIIITFLFLIMIIIQSIFIKNFYFKTGWDVSNLYSYGTLYPKIKDLNLVGANKNYTYLSTYPNNLFIARIYCFVAMHTLGLDFYKALIIINCIIINLTAIILLRILSNFKIKRKNKILGFIFYFILIGISPWVIIPYSDTLGIIFPSIVLLNYSKERRKLYNYFLIGLASTIGFFLKPTVIIIMIAILIIELIKFIDKIIKKEVSKKTLKKCLIVSLMFILGIAIGKIVDLTLEKEYPYEIDRNHSMTIYHYLMMGANKETNGGFNLTDFWNSVNHYGVQEKKEYNISIWKERLKEIDANFLSNKMIYIYNDGTFAWEGEGEFYNSEFEYENKKIYNFYLEYYKKEGKNYKIFFSIHQFFWITILLFCFINVIITKSNDVKLVLLLTFIGQTMFLMIFEARARYLIIYLPIFICLGTLCLNNLKLPKKIEKQEKISV